MRLAGSNVLVTGGAGFIGSHLVDALAGLKCRVRVLDDLSNGREENLGLHFGDRRFKFMKGNVCDPADVARAMEGVDAVFHLATLGVRHSIGHPFLNHRVNAEGTLLVLEEARRAAVKKFIYCSSSEVYGTARYVPMNEEHPTNPCTVYGAGKLAGEAYARAYWLTYGLKTVIIRPFNTFGPRSHHEGDSGEMIPKSIVRSLAGEPVLIFGDGLQTRDFTFVEDTAAGLVEAARCDGLEGGTFNMGNGSERTILDVARTVIRLAGDGRSRIKFLKGRPGDVLRLYAGSEAFRKKTGWKPSVSFAEGLKKTIRWFKSRGEIRVLMNEEKGANW
ncbi:MAG: GDP-mannose 4,6-dehydratase [Nitrospiraceae bacterium]|nr:GDP-mannose 4,6-dehydratase [Nitrospiraceae bacterium]